MFIYILYFNLRLNGLMTNQSETLKKIYFLMFLKRINKDKNKYL